MAGRRIFKELYVQVILAVIVGVALGALWPELGVKLKPLGDGFVKLIKMMIAPIVFVTVTLGIGKVGDLRKVGSVGLKALIYFEGLTTVALVIGLVVVNVLQPGAGIHADPKTLDAAALNPYTGGAKTLNGVDFVLNIIPASAVDAFAKGDILQVLLVSVLFGVAMSRQGERGKLVLDFLERVSEALFATIGLIMRAAPVGALGAMAFTIGKYGPDTLLSLGKLMGGVYLTCVSFVVLVLGAVARLAGFSLWRLLGLIKEELWLVLGTSSSEAALPRLMEKLEGAGCPRPIVGLVVPTGYSFNLDGTAIYLTMAAVFVAQATDTPLTLGHQLTLLAVLLLTSKGAAAVTGAGFITLAATLSSLDVVPVAGLALLLGVDRFMSEARAITNLIGNAVATLAVTRWERAVEDTGSSVWTPRSVLAPRASPDRDQQPGRHGAGADVAQQPERRQSPQGRAALHRHHDGRGDDQRRGDQP
ncbi:dicarboxylate/amino acid:cation symporter [Methylococcus sp. Mc7]|uniref:dicarboxylate/amino acid:cation symporter n=1 Tax=Methylococcus sp. Mc7 TaxID=2860258 RepID=UPI002106243D|nr:dicarboxylate/amino acid:cation symporter [Methylococcus sp. Mc7]